MDSPFTCRICGAVSHGAPIVVREMMLGTGDSFEYRECSACGCVQIAEYPADVAKYYPGEYYSFGAARPRPPGRVETWLRRRRAAGALGKLDPVGLGLRAVLGVPLHYRWFRHMTMDFESRILDVGCGEGRLLGFLRDDGFKHLEGVDPHARDETRRQAGFVIRTSLADVESTFDIVLLSHSLEHMRDQPGVFRELRGVCHSRTWLCIRIPIASHAFRVYGPDWAQFDAPRHFYLHTPKSLEKLANQAGFRVVRMESDSTDFQFWASEQYRSGIALYDPRSHLVAPYGEGSLFGRRQIRSFERQTRELNRRGEGDQAIFYLQTADDGARASTAP